MDLETNSLPLKPPLENEQDVQDATDLAAMGHAQALTRKFDIWSMLALAFCVLGMFNVATGVCHRSVPSISPRGTRWTRFEDITTHVHALSYPDAQLLTRYTHRNLLYLRAGSEQRSHQWRPDHYPLGPGAGHRLQSLRRLLTRRIDQQHAHSPRPGLLGLQTLVHASGPLCFLHVRVD